MTLIHSYNYGDGGFGDFIRSVFAYFVYCRINEIEFLWFNNPFENLFYNDSIEGLEISENFINIGSYNEHTKNFLDLIKNNKEKTYIVRSNVFNFISFETLKQYTKSFLMYLGIKMKHVLKERISVLLECCKEYCDSFSSIHIRLGDKYMPIVNIPSDSRINLNTFPQKIKKILESQEKFVIFSDNREIKQEIKKLKSDIIILDTKIHHTALQGFFEGSLDSVAEFFVLGHSKKIIMMSNSGFPFWSAFIHNVPLFDSDLESFDYLNLKY